MICKESWQEEAYFSLRVWAGAAFRLGVDPMTLELIRSRSGATSELQEPVDLRWWGPVVQRALREKIIRRKGFAPAKSSHGALKARYVGTRHA